MRRALTRHLIAKKKSIREHIHILELERARLKEELSYVAQDQESRVREELFPIESQLISGRAAALRAQLFSRRVSAGNTRECPECFVAHEVLKPLSALAGPHPTLRLKCKRCGFTISADEQHSIQ